MTAPEFFLYREIVMSLCASGVMFSSGDKVRALIPNGASYGQYEEVMIFLAKSEAKAILEMADSIYNGMLERRKNK